MITGASFGALLLAGCDNATNSEATNQTTVTSDNTSTSGEEITRTGDLMKPLGFEDRWLGDENAKVTVIEYASPTCPHCATFHTQIFPEFKKKNSSTLAKCALFCAHSAVRFWTLLCSWLRHVTTQLPTITN